MRVAVLHRGNNIFKKKLKKKGGSLVLVVVNSLAGGVLLDVILDRQIARVQTNKLKTVLFN